MEHFITTFLFFYVPYHNAMLTKVYKTTPSNARRSRFWPNPLILNELHANF